MAAGQEEHAPTAAQCQADADLWNIPPVSEIPLQKIFAARLADAINAFSRMQLGGVSAKTLRARETELLQCTKTDAQNSDRYSLAQLFYNLAVGQRISAFMQKHNLYEQFLAEDGQGKR